MANQEHLDKLKEGVEAWNQWRKEHPDTWPNLQWADLEGVNLQGADLKRANLMRACLKRATLIEAHLEKAYLYRTDLERAILTEAHCEGAHLIEAHLEATNLIGAYCQGAHLVEAHLEGALLMEAHLEGAYLIGAHLEGANLREAHLGKADLRTASLDHATILNGVTLGNEKDGLASLVDISWDDVNLVVINWSRVKMLGDEFRARRRKTGSGVVKSKNQRLDEYRMAVRANRQLAVVLRDQGLNEEADHFAYRAQCLQRVVWRLEGRPLKYLLSWFLYLIAGYGYRPVVTLGWYVLVISVFAWAYYSTWASYHLERLTKHSLSPLGAVIFSITAFHGRGFFLGGDFGYDNIVTLFAAGEAILGLLIEFSFIATFTQRFFAR